jgi:multidrug efflux pump subunit AcrB
MTRVSWSVIVALASTLAAGCQRATELPLPAITVTASYPGANALVVADTVAAPVEQQVNGVEGLVHLVSRSGNDGSYTLTVFFRPDTDLNIAQVLVQNRVALAQPILPDPVNRHGVTVKRQSPGVLLFVSLYSPDGRHNDVSLSNYASTHLKDELSRLPGVQEVVPFGARAYAVRVWLDPDRLAARNLAAADVIQAIKEQNLQPTAGQIARPPHQEGGPFAFSLAVGGRLTDPEKLADLIVKMDDKGHSIRLKDVARVEREADGDSRVRLDGKPSVALGVYPSRQARPREVSAAVLKRLTELKGRFPAGLDYAVAFEFTPNLEAPGGAATPEYLLVDVTLPLAASPQRIDDSLRRGDDLIRATAGVHHTLAFTDNPFDLAPGRPCLLVGLAPADGKRASREQLLRDLRARLGKELPEALVRLRDLSAPGAFPRCGYPIDLAVSGPEADRVRQLAENLANRLKQDQQFTDVLANPESLPQPQLYVDIDRAKAATLGVALKDILTTFESALGKVDVNGLDRTWQVQVRFGENARNQVDTLKVLKVRNSQGNMVPLAALATVRESLGPLVHDRLDLQPMVEITANPAAGVSRAQARTLCETAVQEGRKELGLPAEYRLTWLGGAATAK